ncbi:hypothetical protein [Thalassospira profundimaris]|uniref:Uncharacterized protein n=1 Tax=Thalassospira profundimaris TaxID=502049 RepID=A0A367WP07_9PROT|nr:hypothetical protein [Thalassospira profundimaris]RCK43205.1 hypothetical protein TH30_19500 [Thalassospira profundimaris]
MNNIASGPGKITADTICLDSSESNGFIDRNFVLTNREYYRAMWTAILERARELKLEFRSNAGGQAITYDYYLEYDDVMELVFALSSAQDMHLYGKVLEAESPTAYRCLVEILKSAALQGYAFRPAD